MSGTQHPEQIGQYQIKRLIATGGMGSVYEAVQTNPRRSVAVKVVRPVGEESDMMLSRFRYEAQVLARLRHPGIAEIYEAGTFDDDGRELPFFAMEYIPNAKSLIEYAESEQLDTHHRLELFVQVCEAVHHGHQRGIVHRDLKPANILVDPNGRVKVIDFGVARATDSDLRQTRVHTTVGELIGSVQYMSPEQFKADSDDIDTRSDVYALGAVLYELLTGRMPYDLRGKNIYEIAVIVGEDIPPSISSHSHNLSEELDTIVQMALRKERSQRYQSAHGLGMDVRRFLSGEAISARPPSFTYQFRVFARRNRAVVASAAVAVLALVAGIVVAVLLLVRVEAEKAGAEVQSARATAAQEFLTEVFTEGIPRGWGDEATVEMILEHARAKLAETEFGDPETEADVRDAIGQGFSRIGHYGVAVEEVSHALRLYEQALGTTHDKSIQLRYYLQRRYGVLEDHDQAYQNAVALDSALTKRFGENSPEVLEWHQVMVSVASEAGRNEEALALCQELVQVCESSFGQSNELTVAVGADLAWLLMDTGELDSALRIARDLHSRAARAFGESGDMTSVTRSVLAGVLIAQADLEAASSLYGHRKLPDKLGVLQSFQGDATKLDGPQPKLFVFFETWCPFSRNAMPQLEEQYRQFGDQGIEFVGLTQIRRSASEKTVNQFIRDWGISFAVHQETGEPWQFFECRGTPSMRLVDQGELLWESSWYPNSQMLEGIVSANQKRSGVNP